MIIAHEILHTLGRKHTDLESIMTEDARGDDVRLLRPLDGEVLAFVYGGALDAGANMAKIHARAR